MSEVRFPPGMYRMRNGEKAEVFAERDGFIYGRTPDYTNQAIRWTAEYGAAIRLGVNYDLISPWTEERKPFECWINRHPGGWPQVKAHPTEEAADEHAEGSKRFGPALHMIEATPLTLAAGDLYAGIKNVVKELETHAEALRSAASGSDEPDPSFHIADLLDTHAKYARAALAKARGQQ